MSELKAALDRFGAEVVHVGQFDYASVFRERRLRKPQFLQWARDPRFANVLPYWDNTDDLWGGDTFLPQVMTIDPSSMRRNPSEPGAVTVIAEFGATEGPLMPRQILRAQLERAAAMGYEVQAAFEYEVIILDDDAASTRAKNFQNFDKFIADHKCWSGTTANAYADFVLGMEEEILGHDINLFGLGTELGPGCFELTLGHEEGMKAADDASFIRMAVRAYARKQGKTASFMPFLGAGYPGIGGHCTLSLRDKATGRNLFADPSGHTARLAGQFIAGMMQIVPQAFAMCTSTVNAFRRLAPGSWAPKALTWAEYPYTVAVRSAPATDDLARLEFRVPAADCNTYLTLALMLGAGLDGIERDLPMPAPTIGAHPDFIPEGAQRFPRDLAEAADRLETSEDAARLFGAAFTRNFAAACRHEYAALAKAVSPEERARYLEG